MIDIDDKYVITFDPLNYNIKKRSVNKTTGEPILIQVGAYGTPSSLLKGLLNHRCKVDGEEKKSLKELCDYIENYGKKAEKTINKNMKEVRDLLL